MTADVFEQARGHTVQWNRAILVDDEVFTRKGLLKLIDWEACGFQIVDEADNGKMRWN